MGIPEKNGNYRDYRGYIGVLWGVYGDSGKENGNYCNDYIGFRVLGFFMLMFMSLHA